MKGLVKEFNLCAKNNLVKIGFKKQSNDTYICDSVDDIYGWIGLNMSTKYSGIFLHPIIGLSCKRVYELHDRLMGRKIHKCVSPITILSLEELVENNYKPDWIYKQDDVSNEIKKLISFIISDALPFIKKNADIKCMIELMLKRHGYNHLIRYYIPICYHLIHQNQKACNYAKEVYESMPSKTYSSAEDFKFFYDNFLRYLEDGSFPPISQD